MGCLALAGWQEEDASDEISKSSRCQRRGEGGREVLRTFRDGMVQAGWLMVRGALVSPGALNPTSPCAAAF